MMTTDAATADLSQIHADQPRKGKPTAWRLAVALFAAAVVAGMVVFAETWRSMLQIWVNIDTYNYGLIVPIISLVLVFKMKDRLSSMGPEVSVLGIVATALISVLWVIGDLAGILVLQHLAVLALIPAAGLAIFGIKVMRVLAFPFLYLLLAVPAGEFLIPGMITWTADFSVTALEFLGVPVFRDGPYIRIPEGSFHVVKACSGIRYLLTSVVLGVLFAHLSFRSWRRRAAFLLVCILVPIGANWVRATGIILIGHMSDMKFAAGVDHLVYGWIFFGVVTLIIFLIGNRFREDVAPLTSGPEARSNCGPETSVRVLAPVAVLIGLIVAVPIGPEISRRLLDRTVSSIGIERQEILLPVAGSGWVRHDVIVRDWAPVFVGERFNRQSEYTSGVEKVFITAVYYDRQGQGSELLSNQNSLYDPSSWWLRFESRNTVGDLAGSDMLRVKEMSVSDGSRNRLIWSWYLVSEAEASGAIAATLETFRAAFTAAGSGAFQIAIATDYDHDPDSARRLLNQYLLGHLEQLRDCLQIVSGRDSHCE